MPLLALLLPLRPIHVLLLGLLLYLLLYLLLVLIRVQERLLRVDLTRHCCCRRRSMLQVVHIVVLLEGGAWRRRTNRIRVEAIARHLRAIIVDSIEGRRRR